MFNVQYKKVPYETFLAYLLPEKLLGKTLLND